MEKFWRKVLHCIFAKIKAFCESISSNLNCLSDNKKNVKLFTHDESRSGLMFPMRVRITAKGIKPIQTVDFRFENYYFYGAVEPTSGDRFILEALRQNVADELLKLMNSIVASITGYSYIVNAVNSLMHNH